MINKKEKSVAEALYSSDASPVAQLLQDSLLAT